MVTIDMPAIGVPPGEKPTKASFTPKDVFDRLLEVQGGYRVSWSRVLRCPCRPSDALTDAPKRTCPLCHGDGWMNHKPESYAPPSAAGVLTTLQTRILESYQGVIINGFVSDIRRDKKPLTDSGDAGDGTFRLTVRPDNKLNHYDRIVLLDSLVAFDEVRELPPGETVLPLRYLTDQIVTMRDTTGRALKAEVGDFTLRPDGRVELPSKSRVPVRYGVLYNVHPVARVLEHMHLSRGNITSTKTAKKRKRDLITPNGDPLPLPLQVTCRLEWLL